MKLTTGILLLGMATGAAWAQNPDIIQDTRSTLQNIQKKETIDQNAALAASGQAPASPTPSKPANSNAPAPTSAKPATGSNTTSAPAKPVAKAAVSSPATSAPAKPVVKAAVSSAAASAPAKPVVMPVTSKASEAVKAKPVAKNGTAPAVSVTSANPPKPAATKSKKKSTKIAVKPTEQPKQAVAVEDKKNPVEPKKDEAKTYSAAGRRDPFISPVVNRTMTGSGCSTGKRCLAIDQISLQGVVKSESGMIAVVVNALNKAYFLHENDPVFNGYVVKITGDSIIFKETIQDKLGKPFEREVTKRILTPAV
jgi:Tfp pilus assembly protein PilP